MGHAPSPLEPRFKLHLLGGCEFECAGSPVRLETNKTTALLAYLALQAEPPSRQKLMGLFWGGLPQDRASRNLRHAVWNLRRTLNPPDSSPLILATPQTVAFNHQADHWLDVAEFERLASVPARSAAGEPTEIAHLEHAVDLYCGDLLDGMCVDDAPEFEEWLLVERERLRTLALQALQQLVSDRLAWGEHQDGIRLARRLLAMEPWLEEGHRQMMRLLALAGQRSAALAQYETCRRVLAQELNAEPSRETTALYESIRASIQAARPAPVGATRRLPVPPTRFVGRRDELNRIGELLQTPECRLLTLVGPGGIGKTRLALQAAAAAQQSFHDGVYLAPLAGVGSSDFLLFAIADALGFTFHAGTSARTELVQHLRERELLLLLDNFEHLLQGADLVAEIVQAAPHARILVTSRERLGLSAEWLFPVQGLTYPASPFPPSPQWNEGEQGPGEKFEEYDAVKLFVQSAQRVNLGFRLRPEEAPSVARFCSLVQGMPLAIELAAAWARTLSCREIVEEVEHNLDFLTTSLRDLPARHRSMRVVLDYTWRFVPEPERAVFKRLTVFRGGLSPEAALAVAGANMSLLAALIDKSMLRRTPSGRYELHELLRQYGEQQMEPQERAQARELHGKYFVEFLSQREERLKGPLQKEALDEIAQELENARAAWEWAVEQRQVAELNRCVLALALYYDARGLQHEGEETFRRATERLGGMGRMNETNSSADALLLTRLTARRALFCDRLSLWEQGKELALQSLASARRLGAAGEVAASLAALSMTDAALGNLATASQWALENLEVRRETGDRRGEASALQHLGDAAREMGDYAAAREYLLSSLAISTELGLDEMKAFALLPLGYIECALGEFAQARKHGEEAFAIFQALDNPLTLPLALCILGQSATGLGNYREALDHLSHALEIAQSAHVQSQVLEALSWMVTPLAMTGQTEQALELAALALHHPGSNSEIRERAARLLSELEKELAAEVAAAARARGEGTPLAEVRKIQ